MCVRRDDKHDLCLQLRLLDSASVFVRVCDARRDDELMHEVAEEGSVGLRL